MKACHPAPNDCSLLPKVLIASIATNLFLAGMVAGPYILRRHDPMMPPPPREGFMLDRLASQLPEHDAETLRTIVADQKANLDTSRSAMKDAFHRVHGLMAETQPDMAEIRKALDSIQQADTLRHQGMSAIIQRVAKELPVSSRKHLLELMDERQPFAGQPPHGLPPHDFGGKPPHPPQP